VGWAIVLVVAGVLGTILVLVQRDRGTRPPKVERPIEETSVERLSLEELEEDFRRPALARRFKGHLVEVTGVVVGVMKTEAEQGEQGKPTWLVYLATRPDDEASVCCALADEKSGASKQAPGRGKAKQPRANEKPAPGVAVGERVVLQGKVDVLLSEGLSRPGLVKAHVVRRVRR
jgi:hypothetical protein